MWLERGKASQGFRKSSFIAGLASGKPLTSVLAQHSPHVSGSTHGRPEFYHCCWCALSRWAGRVELGRVGAEQGWDQ